MERAITAHPVVDTYLGKAEVAAARKTRELAAQVATVELPVAVAVAAVLPAGVVAVGVVPGTVLNVAVTVLLAVMLIVQVAALGVSQPVQPVNVEPAAAVAGRTTDVPSA